MINKTGHINPIWTVDDYVNLNYNRDTVADSYLNQFLGAGHIEEQMCLFNYFEPKPMPASIEYIKSHFQELKNLTAAVNLVKPGQYMPYHSDLYLRWMQVHNHNNIETIVRIIVMLEHGEQGQILHVGDCLHTMWKAGDWFSWNGTTMHALYNMSLRNRYAIQLTGCL